MTILACDMGGTRLKIGIIKNGAVIAQRVIPSRSVEGLRARLPQLKQTWLELCNEAGVSFADCSGIGIALPALVDSVNSKVLDEHGKFADALNFDFKNWARSEFNLPIALENDARAALLGEWSAGCAVGATDVVIITLGTGIGSSAIIDGVPLRGKHFQAGCLGGHVTVNYNGNLCACGNSGCAELEASTAQLINLCHKLPEFATSSLATLPDKFGYKEVFDAAAKHDACALQIIQHTLKVWGSVAVNLIHAYDPEVVVLHGGILASGEVVVNGIQSYIDKHAHTPWGRVKVAKGTLGDSAALIGCEQLIKTVI